MSYSEYFKTYDLPRTTTQVDSLYHWQHGETFPPVIVELNPIHACNQKCRYCYTQKKGHPKERLSSELLRRLPEELETYGVQSVLIQGTGEPLMNKDLKIFLVNTKLKIGLTTNGVLFNQVWQDDVLDKLHYVRFSVLDRNPERYAKLHGTTVSDWEKLINNIAYMNKLRHEKEIPVAMWGTIYVHEDNYRHIGDIISFFRGLGMDYLVIQESRYGNYSLDPSDYRYFSETISREAIKDIQREILLQDSNECRVKCRFPINDETFFVGMDKTTWKKDFCQGIYFYGIISSDANIYPCWRFWGNDKDYSYGDLTKQTFREIWEGMRRQEIIKRVLTTSPQGEECAICNATKLNTILAQYNQPNSWRGFLI